MGAPTLAPTLAPAPTVSDVRPWGTWEVLGSGPGWKTKRLTVAPHARLSLQSHRFRSEHWVVVEGTALCTIGSETLLVAAGQRAYVPAGTPHRLANLEEEPLVVVEVQIGDYTGEDDIVRLDDDYGR